MFELAEMLPPRLAGTSLWPLVRQCGIDRAVGQFYPADALMQGEVTRWSYRALLRLKNQYESNGFRLDVIEDRPPLNLTKRGLPGRDDEIAEVLRLIENMGRLGIGVWCYQWMADFTWMRTSTFDRSRGGSTVSGFDMSMLRNAPETEWEPLRADVLWESLEYFLRKVLPVAERWGVRLAMHPDDPPVSSICGVARIMNTVEAFDRLLEIVPSEANTVTFCQGNFRLMTDDLPALIRRLGANNKIAFVHMRDVCGTPEKFTETWHDDGPTDMYACFEAYRDVDFRGVMRPDHVPALFGEESNEPGYSTLGRLFAIGYLRGLQHAVFH